MFKRLAGRSAFAVSSSDEQLRAYAFDGLTSADDKVRPMCKRVSHRVTRAIKVLIVLNLNATEGVTVTFDFADTVMSAAECLALIRSFHRRSASPGVMNTSSAPLAAC